MSNLNESSVYRTSHSGFDHVCKPQAINLTEVNDSLAGLQSELDQNFLANSSRNPGHIGYTFCHNKIDCIYIVPMCLHSALLMPQTKRVIQSLMIQN